MDDLFADDLFYYPYCFQRWFLSFSSDIHHLIKRYTAFVRALNKICSECCWVLC